MWALCSLLSCLPRRTQVERISQDGQLDHVVPDALGADCNSHMQNCCHRCRYQRCDYTCPCHQTKEDGDHLHPSEMQAESSVDGYGFDGGWALKAGGVEVKQDFGEFLISGDTMTTATGQAFTVKYDSRNNTIQFADGIGKLCADGALSVTHTAGTSMYQRFDLPSVETLAPLDDKWFWKDNAYSDVESLLTIRGPCWTLVTGQSEGFGLLHRRTSDGAVTLNNACIRRSNGKLNLQLPSGSTIQYSRHRQRASAIPEGSNE